MTTSATRPASRARRTLRAAVSVLTALAVVLLTGAVLAAGLAEPAPQPQPVAATRVDIGAGPLQLVCPDAPRLSTGAEGTDIDYDAEFGTDPDQMRTRTQAVVLTDAGARPEHVQVGPLGQDSESIDPGPHAATHAHSTTTAAAVLSAEPAADRTPLGAGAAVARADAGDLRGLTIAACVAPSATQWLVGGTTEPGSSARLLLTNAGQTPVSATVDMWADTGAVEDQTEVLVPAGESRSVLLETIWLSERVAVRVSADGGYLAAAIQDSRLHGVAPAGTDVVTATADPTTVLDIGPFQVTDTETEDAAPVVRLVNPATEPATVSVDLFTAEGPRALPGAQDQLLEPGTVTDISLGGVDPGPYAVQVHADLPITGSLVRTVVGEAGELDPDEPVRDRAWITAQAPVERGVLNVPADLVDDVAVVLANPLPHDQQVQLRHIDATGTAADPVTVAVPSGTAQVLGDQVPLDDVVALEISGTAVLATLMGHGRADDGPLLAMLALTPDAAADQHVDVRVGSS